MDGYDAHLIEERWQRVWEDEQSFHVDDPAPGEQSFYQLEMLPYPSGHLHMGHVLNYTMGDVVTHFRRRSGFKVLRPMGWDSFGLPAENAAIKEGGHPREITERNIAAITRQMRRMGWAIDWQREVAAHDPGYYHWTQWLFLKFLEHGLAYRKEAPVNWCPFDQTVLANEHVVDGRCWRCGNVVEARNMAQWFFKITAYSDQLLADLDTIDWPERTKKIQTAWIGRSEGAELLFRVPALDLDIPVFTTRPDTLFGATFFVVAPESPLVERLVEGTEYEAEVLDYAKVAAARPTEEREQREKTGVFTGRHTVNPATGEEIPIWVADYVLMEYGTGAIMAVPAHDERDAEFARVYELPIVTVIDEDGKLVNSQQFDGLPWRDAVGAITAWLGEHARGRPAVNFRLRDWSFSRQRYWGAPIPVVYCDDCGIVPVPEDELPVLLPEVSDYRPKGQPPLASNEEFMNVACPKCGGPGRREADTMDTFVDSSWYFLRYTDPHNSRAPFDRAKADAWMPIDQYIGGIDHAKGHLLYSRFFCKALNDWELLGVREPFQRLFHQGWVRLDGKKMSKSRSGVSPDELIDQFGADPIRIYILFQGPRRSGHRLDARRHRGDRALPATVLAGRVGGGRSARVASGSRHAARPQDARDDPPRHRRHRPALRLQHADRRRDGADQRAVEGARRSRCPLRCRDGGVAAAAVHAARLRGAVGGAGGRRPSVGAGVARARRIVAHERHDRARPAGERQGARPHHGAGGSAGTRADRAGPRVGEGAGARRRCSRAARRRRPGQARQHRRLSRARWRSTAFVSCSPPAWSQRWLRVVAREATSARAVDARCRRPRGRRTAG